MIDEKAIVGARRFTYFPLPIASIFERSFYSFKVGSPAACPAPR